MAEAGEGEMKLQIVPNECSIEGGSSFIITSNQVLPGRGNGTYSVQFGDYGTRQAVPFETMSIQGRGEIPGARRDGTHDITVIVDYINTRGGVLSIGQCTLKYKDEVAELIAQVCHEASQSLDGSNADISSRYARDGRGSYIKKLERVPIDMPMLLYLCDEMAKKGNGKFFSALAKLGFTGKVLEQHREHFEEFATTARQNGHSELAKAIETSRELPCDLVLKTLTFGKLLDSIRAENRSLANFASTTQCHIIPKKGDTALIICNQSFTGTTDEKEPQKLEQQKGSNADLEMVKGAMADFGYEVVLKENLKADDIREEVKKVAGAIKEDSSTPSSFVCFILTYGDKGKIYGSDCKFVYLDEITAEFKKDKCPRLAEKPKLFFIQACRIDNGSDPLMNDSEFRSRSDPAEPHFLIALSLAPEKACLRSEKEGTWAVSNLVTIFKNHHKEQDVCSMLLQVNEKASCEHAKKGYQQPCQLVFTTTKIVKFHPTSRSGVEKHETDKQNEKVQSDRDDEYWSYPMKKQDNVAVIINVEHFQIKNGEIVEFHHREGSDKDVEKLEQLWKNLGFNVKFPEDLKKENILEFLKQVREDIVENSSCFVCCIMTPGSMGTLYGSDGEPLDISAIVDLFKETNCPALAGKPKMFFIEAGRIHRGLIKTMLCLDSSCDASKNSNIWEQANPHEIDFFIGYSTLPGTPNHRHAESGSYYVNALVETFQEYHKDENLMSMMTRVNKKLAENEYFQQCPAPVLSLTRKVYFPSNA